MITSTPAAPATTARIETYTGRAFDVANPDPRDVSVGDISFALAGMFRFCCQSPIRYTVAQHSVRVSEYFPHPRAALAALLHDAHEAYLGDHPPQVKALWPDYLYHAEILQGVINHAFGVSVPPALAVAIKAADVAECWIEAVNFRDAEQSPHWAPRRPANYRTGSAPTIEPWNPERANREFMRRFMELTRAAARE